jgi:transposase
VLTTTAPANFLELSTVTKKQIAALEGVAPRNRDSGTVHGTGMVWGRTHADPGYMATIVATGYNLAVKPFYQCLCGLGKAKKVALIAYMQKLLTALSPIRKPRTPWRTEQPQHA